MDGPPSRAAGLQRWIQKVPIAQESC